MAFADCPIEGAANDRCTIQLERGGELTTPPVKDGELMTPGRVVTLAPGYYLSEATWERLNAEVKRLQEREVWLDAAYKTALEQASKPRWYWYVNAAIAGVVIGVAIREAI